VKKKGEGTKGPGLLGTSYDKTIFLGNALPGSPLFGFPVYSRHQKELGNWSRGKKVRPPDYLERLVGNVKRKPEGIKDC